MYLEYNWTACTYQLRFGDVFTDCRGRRYFNTLAEARECLRQAGLRLGKKTDSRTWPVEAAPARAN